MEFEYKMADKGIPFEKIMEINDYNRQIKERHKAHLINNFFKGTNLQTKREVSAEEIHWADNPVIIDDRFIFFFKGKVNDLELKSVLQRKNMKSKCNWMINGQPSVNCKQLYSH